MSHASAEAAQQIAHVRWHGDTLHHWHVGVTALDDETDPVRHPRTEDITVFFGVPVYRTLEMDRNAICAVPRGQSSCHWVDGKVGGEIVGHSESNDDR